MNVQEIIELGVGCVGFIVSAIMFIVSKVKAYKEGKIQTLNDLLTEALIPLMEEAERLLDNGQEKENWVIKKLSLATHIDFYTHKKELAMAKEIISNICKQTKIEVNKNRLIQVKEEKEIEQKEVGTNGVF